MQLQLLLLKAYAQTAEKKGEEWVTLTKLGGKLRQIDAQFKVKTYDSSWLKDLVERYPHVFQFQTLVGGQMAIRLNAGKEDLAGTRKQSKDKETSR